MTAAKASRNAKYTTVFDVFVVLYVQYARVTPSEARTVKESGIK